MKANKLLPAIKASSLPATDLVLRDGERRQIKCPKCGTWTALKRSIIKPHPDDEQQRCANSLRLVDLDITPEEWGAAVLEADYTARHRRPTTVIPRPKAGAPAPAIVQLRRRHPRGPEQHHLRHAAEQLAAHRRVCRACTPVPAPGEPVWVIGPCRVGRQLQQQAASAQRIYTTRATAHR